MKKIDITFGIPIYNSEKYIIDLFKCFKNSKNFTYEIILVNDGSTDNSLTLCNEFKKNTPNINIRVFTKENEGVSATRNYIIKKSMGEWITFVDSDDTINFSEFEKMYEFLKTKQFDFSINVESTRQYNKIIKRKNKLPFLLENQIINSPVGRLYNRELLLNNSILFNNNYSLGEDLLFNLNYYLKCSNIIYTNYNYYNVRVINDNSLTHKYRENKFYELLSVNKECVNVCSNCTNDILKSLEYLLSKSCLSCIKDEVRVNKSNILKYAKKIKKETKSRFFILNNFKTTIIHFIWFYMPSFFSVLIVKLRNLIIK